MGLGYGNRRESGRRAIFFIFILVIDVGQFFFCFFVQVVPIGFRTR